MDSGSDLNILGNHSHVQFLKRGYVLKKSPFQSAVSCSGAACKIIGQIKLPIWVDGKTIDLDFEVIPSVTDDFIFGIEFWQRSGLLSKIEGSISKFSLSEPGHIGIIHGSPVQNVNNSSNVNNNVNINNNVNNNENSTSVNNLKEVKEESSSCSSASKQKPLSCEQQKRLDLVVEKFKSISFEKKGLGRTHLVEYKIETSGEPIKQRFYRASPARQQIINEELDKLINLGVLEESSSPWASWSQRHQVVFVFALTVVS